MDSQTFVRAEASRLSELRKSIAVLGIRLQSPPAVEGETVDNTALPKPLVSVELEICGVPAGIWFLDSTEIRLPLVAKELPLLNLDALSRTRRVVEETVQALSPSNFFEFWSGLFKEAALDSRLPLVVGALADLSIFAENATGNIEQRASHRAKRGIDRLESCRQSFEAVGLPFAPEQLRALRETYPRVLDFMSESLVEVASALEKRLDMVTEVHAEQLRQHLPTITLPLRITRGIRDALDEKEWAESLWLEFRSPAGYLAVLPWERWLQRITRGPILRLSQHAVDAVPAAGPLQVLFCCTAPSREDGPSARAVASAIRGIAGVGPVLPLVHVFPDKIYHQALRDALGSCGPNIRLYDLPSESDADGESSRNPWLEWVRQRLGLRAVDVLHLVAPTGFSANEPVITGAMSPTACAAGRPDSLRVLRGVEITQLADEAGASTIVLTSFGSESSRSAGRLLCDELSAYRPGAVALHDFSVDEWSRALGGTIELVQLYRHIRGDGERMSADSTPTLYCHPARLLGNTARAEAAPSPLDPLWVAGTQRFLEQTLSAALSTGVEDELLDAAQRGATEAVRFLSTLLAKTTEELSTAEAQSKK